MRLNCCNILDVRGQVANITSGPEGNLKAKVGTEFSAECVVVGNQDEYHNLYFKKVRSTDCFNL